MELTLKQRPTLTCSEHLRGTQVTVNSLKGRGTWRKLEKKGDKSIMAEFQGLGRMVHTAEVGEHEFIYTHQYTFAILST